MTQPGPNTPKVDYSEVEIKQGHARPVQSPAYIGKRDTGKEENRIPQPLKADVAGHNSTADHSRHST
jgi:hypothetical protein